MKVFDAPAGIAGKDLTKVLTLAQSVIVPVLPSPIDMKAAIYRDVKKTSTNS